MATNERDPWDRPEDSPIWPEPPRRSHRRGSGTPPASHDETWWRPQEQSALVDDEGRDEATVYRSSRARSTSRRSRRAAPLSAQERKMARRHRIRTILIIVTIMALLALASAFLVYKYLVKFNREDLHGLGNRPHELNNSLNILLIGSDNRDGENAKYGKDVPGERGDVTILLHISADGNSATVVNIPRDSMVQIPSCESHSGKPLPPEYTTFNAAYARGGASCTIRTFEQLTQIHINHFVKVDFTGFKKMVDALGKVEICLPQAVNDEDSKLNLPAGRQEVDGETALAYVRMRYGMGDHSDLSRVKRQQAFLSAVAQKATSTSILTNPARLGSFIRAATSATTVDSEFGDKEMLSLASTLKGIGLENIAFATLPTRPYPANLQRVEWTAAADALWEQIRNDTYKPGATKKPAATVAADGTPIVTIAPDAVQVRVLNATGQSGLAARVSEDLKAKGFNVVSTGTSPVRATTTNVRHDSEFKETARTLTASVIGAKDQVVPGMGSVVELVVGTNYTGLRTITVKASTEHIKVRNAAEDICKQ